jgi:hypothetical protein
MSIALPPGMASPQNLRLAAALLILPLALTFNSSRAFAEESKLDVVTAEVRSALGERMGAKAYPHVAAAVRSMANSMDAISVETEVAGDTTTVRISTPQHRGSITVSGDRVVAEGHRALETELAVIVGSVATRQQIDFRLKSQARSSGTRPKATTRAKLTTQPKPARRGFRGFLKRLPGVKHLRRPRFLTRNRNRTPKAKGKQRKLRLPRRK